LNHLPRSLSLLPATEDEGKGFQGEELRAEVDVEVARFEKKPL